MYLQRVERREQGKQLMFQRGLLEYKKVRSILPVARYTSKYTHADGAPVQCVDAASREEASKGREGDLASPPSLCQAADCGGL